MFWVLATETTKTASEHLTNQTIVNIVLAAVAVATLLWTIIKDRRDSKEHEVKDRTDYAELSLEGLRSLTDELRQELSRSRAMAQELEARYSDRQRVLVKEIIRLREEVTLLRMLLEENNIKAPPPAISLVPPKLLGEI